MKRPLSRTSALSILLLVTLAACNLPFGPTPVQPTFPIPNQTMTALFSTPLPTLVITSPLKSTVTITPSPTVTPLAQFATPAPTSSATAAPSQTPVPTQPPAPTLPNPTATKDLSHRSGAEVEASYLAAPPKIDGDWNDLPSKEYPAEIVVFGASRWKGRNDLTASFKIGWDSAYLYLGVKVRDDIYVQNAKGEEIFKGDSLEILLDTALISDIADDSLSDDDFQLGISPGRPTVSGEREAYLWFPTILAGARKGVVISSNRSDADGITRIEAAIPWTVFGITPKNGGQYGFALSVSDNDYSAENIQQKMVSNVKDRSLVDPTSWGILTLIR